jgi:prepilin-type N-terminal cleavage/methylation domain-containing protein
MHNVTRRAFTLIELLVAMVLLGLVSVSIYKAMVGAQRFSTAQSQQINVQATLRLAPVLANELRQIDASDSDIVSMSARSVTFRAMRQLGFICNPPVLGGSLATAVTFTVRSSALYTMRAFNTATDSLLIFYEGKSDRTDDGWLPASLTAVTSLNCPDGTSGKQLTTVIRTPLQTGQSNTNGYVTSGAPVWGFEPVTYSVYKPAGDSLYWVGYRTGSTTLPFVGPLSDSTGLALSYYDSTGATTANKTRVALIQVQLQARSQMALRAQVGTVAPKSASTTLWVALRNNKRY